MASTTKLTRRTVEAFRYDPKRPAVQSRWDSVLPGFGVRVFPNGSKTYFLDYRVNGTRRRISIGKHGKLTVDEARKLARQKAGEVAAGRDPLNERMAKRDAARQERAEITMKQFAPIYIENARTVGNPVGRTRKPKKTWREDERRINKYILPTFGAKRLPHVTRSDVVRLHKKIGTNAPVEANRVLALIGVMFTTAAEMGHVPEGLANPAKGVTPFAENERDRWVTPAEMPRLIAALIQEPNISIRALVLLSLMLGCRRSELLGAQWTYIDVERRTLKLPRTKTGNVHTIPLPQPALDVLAALPRMLGNPHIFPSPIEPGQPMTKPKRQWERIRRRAGLEDVRFHDLRRTTGSWLATSGESLHLIGNILNHTSTDTTKIYARLAEDAERAALDRHAAALNVIIEKASA